MQYVKKDPFKRAVLILLKWLTLIRGYWSNHQRVTFLLNWQFNVANLRSVPPLPLLILTQQSYNLLLLCRKVILNMYRKVPESTKYLVHH